MSFAIGIYDVFAYTVPGFLYMYVIFVIFSLIGGSKFAQIDWSTISEGYGVILFVLLLGVAYLLGHIFDVFAHWFVFRFIKHRKIADEMLERTKKLHADLDIQFNSKDRGLLFSMLRQRNLEHAHIIDSFEANSIMLRNVSLGSFLLALLQVPSLILRFSWFTVLVAVGLLLFSFITRNRSQMFRSWAVTEIFEASLRYGSSLKEVIEYDRKERTTSSLRRKVSSKKERQ